MNFIDIFAQYWGVGAVVIGAIIYYFTHKATATAFAKKKISALMLGAEKFAEDFVLENGQAKFDWVVEKGYALLPAPFKMFINFELFKKLAQSIFDDAVELAKKHKAEDQSK